MPGFSATRRISSATACTPASSFIGGTAPAANNRPSPSWVWSDAQSLYARACTPANSSSAIDCRPSIDVGYSTARSMPSVSMSTSRALALCAAGRTSLYGISPLRTWSTFSSGKPAVPASDMKFDGVTVPL